MHDIMSNSASQSQFDWAKNIPCRNVQIHGFCKWENKGCSFNHESARQQQQQPSSTTTGPITNNDSSSISPAIMTTTNNNDLTENNSNVSSGKTGIVITSKSNPSVPINFNEQLHKTSSSANINTITPDKKKFNFDIPSFTPVGSLTTQLAAMSPSLKDIPSFIPSNSNSNSSNPTVNGGGAQDMQPTPSSGFNPESAPVFTPSGIANPFNPSNMNIPNANGPTSGVTSQQPPTQAAVVQPEEPFFIQNNLFPINYHLYAPQPPPHVESNKLPHERTVSDLFISDRLREYIQRKNEESLKSIPNTQAGLPFHVNQYHSLFPIDQNFENSTKSFAYVSSIYKCVSNDDGKLYAMRRIEGVPITTSKCFNSVRKWQKLECANIIKLREVFTTRSFGDNSLILIYDYYPMSLTLMETHFFKIGNNNLELITEDLLWNYLVQLTNATIEIHKAGLVVSTLNPSKVIVTNKGRIRLSAGGAYDIIRKAKKKEDEPELDIKEQQKLDIKELGSLILNFARSTILLRDPQTTDIKEIINQLTFSDRFKETLSYLFRDDANLQRFQEILAPEIMRISNGLQDSSDYLESVLVKEVENARLVRLFAKLDFISERPEFVKDGSWSETGERYPIKLFKDYIFHQVDERGNPVVDLTHVINCLNKLDAGTDENMLLVSPDEMTCLIMSYRNLKELVDKSFKQLLGP